MEKLNSGVGGGGSEDTDTTASDEEEPSNKLEERVGVGTGVKKVGGSGTSTAGNDNTSTSSTDSNGSSATGSSGSPSTSGTDTTTDEPQVTTPGGAEAVAPGGDQSGGGSSADTSTPTGSTGSGSTGGGARDLDPTKVEAAVDDGGASGTSTGSRSSPATDAPSMTGPGGQQRDGTQPPTQSGNGDAAIPEERKSEIKGQVILNNPGLFDTGPGDEDGGQFGSEDIVVRRTDDGGITAEISDSAQREIARSKFINNLARGDAADRLTSATAENERTEEARQREKSREDLRERFDTGSLGKEDVEVEQTDGGFRAILSDQARQKIVRDRVAEQSSLIGPGGQYDQDDVVVEETKNGGFRAFIDPELVDAREEVTERAAGARSDRLVSTGDSFNIQGEQSSASTTGEQDQSLAEAADIGQATENPIQFLRGAGPERQEDVINALTGGLQEKGESFQNRIRAKLTPGEGTVSQDEVARGIQTDLLGRESAVTQQDISNRSRRSLSNNREELAAAASLGVAAPEPASTTAGLAVLGGLALLGAAQSNQEVSEISVPEQPQQEQSEIEAPTEPAEQSGELQPQEFITDEELQPEVSERGTSSEIEVPNEPDRTGIDEPLAAGGIVVTTAREEAEEEDTEIQKNDEEMVVNVPEEFVPEEEVTIGEPTESEFDRQQAEDLLREEESVDEGTQERLAEREEFVSSEEEQLVDQQLVDEQFGEETQAEEQLARQEARQGEQPAGDVEFASGVGVGEGVGVGLLEGSPGAETGAVADQGLGSSTATTGQQLGQFQGTEVAQLQQARLGEAGLATQMQLEALFQQQTEEFGNPAETETVTTTPDRNRRGYDPDLLGEDPLSDSEAPASPQFGEEGPLAPGWLSQNATTIATRGLQAPESPSQETLEGRPGGEQLLGELPTEQQLEGGEEFEQVEDLFGGFGFGGGADEASADGFDFFGGGGE